MKNQTETYRGIARSCAADQLRRTSRTINRFYARSFRDSGLTGNQFSLLVAIRLRGPAMISELAVVTGIDRTTLTRNLKPLEALGYIAVEAAADQRQQLVAISKAGVAVLEAARQSWQQAQSRVQKRFGAARLRRLTSELAALRAAVADD